MRCFSFSTRTPAGETLQLTGFGEHREELLAGLVIGSFQASWALAATAPNPRADHSSDDKEVENPWKTLRKNSEGQH